MMHKENILAWKALCRRVGVYLYNYNLADTAMPFTRRLAWSKDLPNLYKWGVHDATIESMANWHTMVPGNYVIANLLWDVNSDVAAMLDEFYANYYGPAGPAMREYNTLLENAYESTNAFAGCTFSMHRIFTPALMGKLEAALAKALVRAKSEPLITRRVGVTRHSLNFAKHWLAMRSALSDFRLAEAEKHAQAFLDEYKTADKAYPGYFATYIEDRRREPRVDVLTQLALAQYPDGSTPEVAAVVRTATFLFAAGQETTARLLATAIRYLAEHPELQDELREHRERIPDFIEEALRIESPVKADFRLARRATTVGQVEIGAGTPVMLLNGAANRDPRRFECPAEFRVDRPNAKDHLAFGRGAHACPGGPLARAEGRIIIERILDRMHDIRLSEEHHGPGTARRFEYEPTWILRGLRELHIDYTPTDYERPPRY